MRSRTDWQRGGGAWRSPPRVRRLILTSQSTVSSLWALPLTEAQDRLSSVSYTHLRAHETPEHLVCRLLLEKKKQKYQHTSKEFATISNNKKYRTQKQTT